MLCCKYSAGIRCVIVYGYVLSKVRNPASNICLDTLNKDEKVEFELGLFHCQGGKSSAEVEITVVLSDEYNFNSCHFLVAVPVPAAIMCWSQSTQVCYVEPG